MSKGGFLKSFPIKGKGGTSGHRSSFDPYHSRMAGMVMPHDNRYHGERPTNLPKCLALPLRCLGSPVGYPYAVCFTFERTYQHSPLRREKGLCRKAGQV